VRKSFRLHNGEMLRCFDIATIELEDEFRGQGFFKLFIDRFHKTNRRENIFFESVLNPKLYVYLTKFGFIPTGDKESLNLILLEYGK
jgi:predicted acetyltransferase